VLLVVRTVCTSSRAFFSRRKTTEPEQFAPETFVFDMTEHEQVGLTSSHCALNTP
jgi:hypothetical protein